MDHAADHAQILVPPPLVFLGYLLGALLLNRAVPFPIPWMDPAHAAGGIAVLIGLALGGAAVAAMVRQHTSPGPHEPSTTLVTDGPFGFTRNPIYLGFLLIYLGFSWLAGTFWGLLLSPFLLATVTRAIIKPEEKYLGGKFAADYSSYRSRVRRWI
jgi:protein-S-isoprenylcysteine O-methyltransferase Ste14